MDDNAPEPIKSVFELASGETSELWLWPSNVPSISCSWVSNARKGRVLIMGDAAHTFPPTGGQGVAMTVEDGDGLGYYSWTAIEVRHFRGSA